MEKKAKALQVTAFLTAVSGATLLLSAGTTPVQASTADHCREPKQTVTKDRRIHGCAFIEYGLTPSPAAPAPGNPGPSNPPPQGGGGGAGGGGGGPGTGGGYNT